MMVGMNRKVQWIQVLTSTEENVYFWGFHLSYLYKINVYRKVTQYCCAVHFFSKYFETVLKNKSLRGLLCLYIISNNQQNCVLKT